MCSWQAVALSRLFTGDEQLDDAVKRARTVRNKAAEHFEERGLETLYLACGMATWTNPRGAATPRAPVLLVSGAASAPGRRAGGVRALDRRRARGQPDALQMLAAEFELSLRSGGAA